MGERRVYEVYPAGSSTEPMSRIVWRFLPAKPDKASRMTSDLDGWFPACPRLGRDAMKPDMRVMPGSGRKRIGCRE